jgi:Xaa-Pro dipeptidase
MKDIEIKENKIRELLAGKEMSGVILSTQTNLLWFTCGKRNEILKNADISLVYLFITRNKKYLVSSSSDLDRVMNEELEGLGFEPIKYEWYNSSPIDAIRKLEPSGKIGADFSDSGVENIEADLTELRIDLSAIEIEKIKKFCGEYSMLLTDFCSALKPGMTERKLADEFNYACSSYGIRVHVMLVGSDERIFKYRHPAVTDKKIDKYILLATGAEKEGLNITITRSVYFGKVPKDISQKQKAVNFIEAAYCSNSKPGVSLKEIFDFGKKAYKDTGYADEWKNHTQGGILGYKAREIVASDSTEYRLKNSNLLSWNPTVAGAKAEDIILVAGNKAQQLSIDERWPYEEISAGNEKFKKPLILEL